LVAGTTTMPGSAAGRDATTVFDQMTLAQRVGQLFMVGTPATSAAGATLSDISRYHVGNVILTGRSWDGTAHTASVTRRLQGGTTSSATLGVRLLVATDQEGGYVQVLHGPGFSEMPTALRQGGWSLDHLRTSAGGWARQLRSAGVNLDLAPVADTVPSAQAAADNPPIGYWKREFGFTPTRVRNHAVAFSRGMTANGVAVTAKHFPGLGRVHQNPDTSSGVTDWVTRRGDPYFAPFQGAVNAGVPFVMMSTAYYARIDPHHPAAFSPFIIRQLLRGDLGFRGVVISDDLGDARQVAAWSYGARAVSFLASGGTVVLTVDPSVLPQMYGAVLNRARTSATFRAQVNHDALLVLRQKQRQGLLG
jgi:beta-N-acetylhexosaminidase